MVQGRRKYGSWGLSKGRRGEMSIAHSCRGLIVGVGENLLDRHASLVSLRRVEIDATFFTGSGGRVGIDGPKLGINLLKCGCRSRKTHKTSVLCYKAASTVKQLRSWPFPNKIRPAKLVRPKDASAVEKTETKDSTSKPLENSRTGQGGSRPDLEDESNISTVCQAALNGKPAGLVLKSRKHLDYAVNYGKKVQPTLNSKHEAGAPGLQLGSACSELSCDHFSRCSGCVIETAIDHPPVLRDAVNFFQTHGVSDFSLTTGSKWEWRCRAKLAVRGTTQTPLIGLFEEGSHAIVDIPHCRVHHPSINAAVEVLKQAITTLGVEPYNDETSSGELRYVQMVVSTFNTSLPAAERYDTGKVQVTLIWNARDENSAEAKNLQTVAEFMWRRGGIRSDRPILHSVWANFQTSLTNVIFGGRWRHLLGEQDLWERVGGVDICFTPGSFGQANTKVFEELLRKLQMNVKRGSAVVELYAGVGIIGLSLAATRACRIVKCVEVNKESRDSFQRSLARLPESVDCKISWHCADASVTPINWLEGSDVVIVDPPRKGLDPPVVEALRTASMRGQGRKKSPSAKSSSKVEKRPWILRAKQESVGKEGSSAEEVDGTWPHTLIYVSCGWQAFMKDCVSLVKDDAWHLDNAQAFHLFPGTDSIEVLAVFKRGKGSKTLKRQKSRKTKHPPTLLARKTVGVKLLQLKNL